MDRPWKRKNKKEEEFTNRIKSRDISLEKCMCGGKERITEPCDSGRGADGRDGEGVSIPSPASLHLQAGESARLPGTENKPYIQFTVTDTRFRSFRTNC